MRVTEWRFAPGAETGWHRHAADYVVAPLLDGELLLEEPGGASRTATLKRHVPYARREGGETSEMTERRPNGRQAGAWDVSKRAPILPEFRPVDGSQGWRRARTAPADPRSR